MAKICRTCLQKCKRTFTTNQNLGVFGGEEVRISYVLRFCIPELYLGLSSNPEICHNCKESLKVAYLFKKKCLLTEQIIGNYLKNTRSTGKSVDLHDVLAYTDIHQCVSLDDEQPEQPVSTPPLAISTSEEILSDWDVSSLATAANQLKPPVLNDIEVRQSAPNPTNSKETPSLNTNEGIKVLKFCEQTGLFVNINQQGNKFQFTNNFVSRIQKSLSPVQVGNDFVNAVKNNFVNSVKNPCQSVTSSEGLESICKITSVFSLSTDPENKNGGDSEQSAVNKEQKEKDGMVQIKNEPVDILVNEVNPEIAMDEDTLDASETASYQNLECDENLQGIIDNIPEINDSNHYVDIPEFVQINNFGLKELEELRRIQQDQKQKDSTEKENSLKTENTILPSSNMPALLNMNKEKVVKVTDAKEPSPSNAPSLTPIEQDHLGSKASVKIVELGPEHFEKIPEVVYIDGKKYMKFKNEFKYIPEMKDESDVIILKKFAVTSGASDKTGILLKRSIDTEPSSGLSAGEAVTENNPTVSASALDVAANITDIKEETTPKTEDPVLSAPAQINPVRRRRKKLKIVPVGENRFALLGSNSVSLLKKNIHHIPVDSSSRNSSNDKDVVVLFTNFTMDGTYVNDHDYLINPYKRNKVLINESDQWLCMCYICNKKHFTQDHVRHMSTHDPKCKICMVDLGTPYMLNVHVKSHTKPCRQCTERVPYGQIESHEHSHYIDELEFEKEPKRKKYAHLRARRRRARGQLKMPGDMQRMRTTNRCSWTEGSMRSALKAVQNGQSHRDAARRFNVPFSTLHDRVKRGHYYPARMGARTVFTIEQETEICQHLLRLSKIFFELTPFQIRKAVFEYAEIHSIPNRFNRDKKMAGKDWMSAFIQRQPDLGCSKHVFGKDAVHKFYENIIFLMEEYKFPPARIFNVDETKIMIDKHSASNGLPEEKNVTVCCCMSANGAFTPPLFVFPCLETMPDLERDGPPGAVYKGTYNGWITEEVFYAWLQHFTNINKPTKSDPVLLILDNHYSHISLRIDNFCRERGVMLLSLPPYSSDLVQPLDPAFFKPLKGAYDAECDLFMKSHDYENMPMHDVAHLFGKAYTRVAIPSIAIKAFEVSGICPINREVICPSQGNLSISRLSPEPNCSTSQRSCSEDESLGKTEDLLLEMAELKRRNKRKKFRAASRSEEEFGDNRNMLVETSSASEVD